MVTINYSASATTTFAGLGPAQDFSYRAIQNPSGGAMTYVTSPSAADTIVKQTTGTITNFTLAVTDSTYLQGHSFQALQNIAVDTSGHCTYVADGIAEVNIATPVGSRTYTQPMSQTATVQQFSSFKSTLTLPNNSLAYHVYNAINTMVGTLANNDTNGNVWQSNNHSTSALSAVRNTNCITNNVLDLSAIAAATSYGSGLDFPGVLISPHHAIFAAHVNPSGTYAWLTASGVPAYSTITQTATIPGGISTGTPDITVAYFTNPITGITPMKTLPTNWASYLPSVANGYAGGTFSYAVPPALTKGVWRGSEAVDCISVDDWYYRLATYNFMQVRPSVFSNMTSWAATIVSGESSSPTFIPVDVNNPTSGFSYQPVLIGMMTDTMGNMGSIPDYSAAITTAMQSTAQAAGDAAYASYSMGTISLANFPTIF